MNLQLSAGRVLLCFSLLSVPVGGVFAGDAHDADIAEARALVKDYATRLKGELKHALKEEGVVQAIETCHLKAPDITTEASDKSGWNVRRTSLKVRNLEDAPDKWEAKVLDEFEKRKEAGESPKTLEYSEVVEKEGKRYFRYMKAIPTREVCLKCHGRKLDPKVAKQLDSLYPFDQARGFKVGDLRGAFSLSKPLQK